MKNIVFILLSCFVLIGNAQEADSILILHDYQEGVGLRIKWIPTTNDVFFAGYKQGYNVYRSKVKKENGGEALAPFEQLNQETIRLWSEEKLNTELPKDSMLEVASIFIKGYQEYQAREVATDASEAYDNEEADDLLHLMAAFSSINSNAFSEALGLYFLDKTAIQGEKYVYKVEVAKGEPYTSYLIIQKVVQKRSPKVLGLQPSLRTKVIALSWFNTANFGYPYFNIYRAEKRKGPFIKLNDMPYVGSSGIAVKDKSKATYQDSIPEYGKTYFYKVAGVNAFESEGVASDIVEIKASYLLRHQPMIVNSQIVDNANVALEWIYDNTEREYIEGFNVYRAVVGSGPYFKINDKLLSPKANSFTDETMKPNSNHYLISAVGFTGDSAISVSHMRLLLDSIPPVTPIVVSGTCDTNGVVKLEWELNEELDLLGYRLFKTYRTDLESDRVFPGDTLTTVIYDTIDLKMPYSKIYYRIFALDKHFNASDPTRYIEVILPDKNPPSPGFLTDYAVGMSGITISWRNSSAYDLKKMHLMRKADTDFGFKTLLTLSGDSLSTNKYTDTTTKSFTEYHYTVIAEDESGLKSKPSKGFIIKQLDKRKVLGVTDLSALASKENRMVKLSWQFLDNAVGFRIYRSRNGGPLTTHKFVKGSAREYYDKELKPNSEYTYMIVAELRGGYQSGFSKKTNVTY